MTVHVQYFAVLREQRGLSNEEVRCDAATPAELFDELRNQHSFTLHPSLVRAAVNGAFAPMDSPLREGDRVVFVPPVAGG